MHPHTPFPRRHRVGAVLLTLACVAGLAACNRGPAGSEAQTAKTAEAAPVPRYDAKLSLVNNNGNLRYDGNVDSEAAKQAVIAALAHAYGAERVSGDLAVDPYARPATWAANLPKFATAFQQPGAAVSFQGQRIELSGQVAEADRAALLEQARTLYPGYAYTGLFEGVGAGPANAALAALDKQASAAEVVRALNQTPIAFEGDSARIAAASLDALGDAAKAIQAAPAQTRVEIYGPPGGGASEEEQALSKARAEAVKVLLVVNGVSPGAIETKAAGPDSGRGISFKLVK
ncbi:OmpA family protein [Lysobacter sp. Root604]|uniref:OmpA family protein n=1 Tax=Lysobacter sp. Root604 TaxID=1736568 RepID=UPI00138F5943|nr:OmpA family protein [Lysobacter sp. Root604]